MKVTSLEQLKNIKNSVVVELPPFADGTPFCAELQKPNMILMMKAGNIPNSLLSIAAEVFNKGNTSQVIENAVKKPNEFKAFVELLLYLADKCLVSPTFNQLEEYGIILTEDQLSAILMFVQGGAKALEPFRSKQEHSEDIESVKEI